MRLCDLLFHGEKSRAICKEIFQEWEKQGYHLVVDDRHYRYVYKRLKELGLARRKLLTNIHDSRKRHYALVPSKHQMMEVCAEVERIVSKTVSWFYR